MDPIYAQPLPPDKRQEKFKQHKSLNADRAILGRATLLGGLAFCALGMGALYGTIGYVNLYPKTLDCRPFAYTVDQSTGIISVPVTLTDAAISFSEATDRQYIKRYIEACSGYVPVMDSRNDHVCKIMSSPDQQARIDADRARPDSFIKKLSLTGHVQIENVRMYRQPDGANRTRSYFVQFIASQWNGDKQAPDVPWSGTVDFQWHPELGIMPADRDDNPGGFQMLAYSVSPDVDRRMR